MMQITGWRSYQNGMNVIFYSFAVWHSYDSTSHTTGMMQVRGNLHTRMVWTSYSTFCKRIRPTLIVLRNSENLTGDTKNKNNFLSIMCKLNERITWQKTISRWTAKNCNISKDIGAMKWALDRLPTQARLHFAQEAMSVASLLSLS